MADRPGACVPAPATPLICPPGIVMATCAGRLLGTPGAGTCSSGCCDSTAKGLALALLLLETWTLPVDCKLAVLPSVLAVVIRAAWTAKGLTWLPALPVDKFFGRSATAAGSLDA